MAKKAIPSVERTLVQFVRMIENACSLNAKTTVDEEAKVKLREQLDALKISLKITKQSTSDKSNDFESYVEPFIQNALSRLPRTGAAKITDALYDVKVDAKSALATYEGPNAELRATILMLKRLKANASETARELGSRIRALEDAMNEIRPLVRDANH